MSSFIFVPQEDELNLLEQSYLNEDLEDTCPTAGFDNIKKFVNETRHRIIAVKAGMPYEEHVKLAEVRIFTCLFIPLHTGNPSTSALANSGDRDEMQQNAAYHQGLHCLLY